MKDRLKNITREYNRASDEVYVASKQELWRQKHTEFTGSGRERMVAFQRGMVTFQKFMQGMVAFQQFIQGVVIFQQFVLGVVVLQQFMQGVIPFQQHMHGVIAF